MNTRCSIRHEHGAALVISLLMVAVLLVVASGALTTSRIETQITRHDTKAKQMHLAAEYALALGENIAEQATDERTLADALHSLAGRLYGKQQQPNWSQCKWDDRDSMDVSVFFADPRNLVPNDLPPPAANLPGAP